MRLFQRALLAVSFFVVTINASAQLAALDGNWYSTQWKYGYVLKDGIGVATSTNSPNFQVGQTILQLTATSPNTFTGQQVYTDGKFYKVNVTLQADGRLYFEGEKNAKWVMGRVGVSPLASTPSIQAIQTNASASGSTSTSPSFDCSKASNKVERTICSVDSLSTLDNQLAIAYKNAGYSYKQSQLDWLKRRNECGDDANCLSSEYKARIDFLVSVSSKPPSVSKMHVSPNLSIKDTQQGKNIVDISDVLMEKGAGFAYKYADWYLQSLDKTRKRTLCNLDLHVRRGINYCLGFLSVYTNQNGQDSISPNLKRAVIKLSQDNLSKEFVYARDSYCKIQLSRSTFENGVKDYPDAEKFRNNAKMVEGQYMSECGPDIQALDSIISEARLVNEADIPNILVKVQAEAERNPLFDANKAGFEEGFFWLNDKKFTASMALKIPAEIKSGRVKRFAGILFWGYIDSYSEESNRIVANLCTSPQKPCTEAVKAIFAPQPNPAFPNASLEYLSKAKLFLKRAVDEKSGVRLNGFTGIFSNTGGFFIDVQGWTILR